MGFWKGLGALCLIITGVFIFFGLVAGLVIGGVQLESKSRTGCWKNDIIFREVSFLSDYSCDSLIKMMVSIYNPIKGEYLCNGEVSHVVEYDVYDMQKYYRENCLEEKYEL